MEEWNEYGELQEQLSSTAPAALTPSTSAKNTPSKPPTTTSAASSTSTPIRNTPAVSFAENVPPKQSQSAEAASKPPVGGVETSFSLAMRQAGKEAAEKAKLKPKSTASKPSASTNAQLSKLDNSAPSGLPPPSGVTDSASAAAPDNGTAEVTSKADAVPETGADISKDGTSNIVDEPSVAASEPEGRKDSATTHVTDSSLGNLKATESTDSIAASTSETGFAPPTGIMKHRGSSISAASKDEIKEVEEATKIEEEPEEEETAAASIKSDAQQEDKSAVEKSSGEEPHVQSTGETEGTEVDRVKGRLSQDASPANSEELDATGAEGNSASSKAQEIHQDPPSTKTQEQGAADPAMAGNSVAD